MGIKECVICGSTEKSASYWLCKPCAVEWSCYKVPFRDWPEWVKELKRMEDRRLKREAKYGEEIVLDPEHIDMLIEKGYSGP